MQSVIEGFEKNVNKESNQLFATDDSWCALIVMYFRVLILSPLSLRVENAQVKGYTSISWKYYIINFFS